MIEAGSSIAHRLLCAALAALASLPVSTSLAVEAQLPRLEARPWAARGVSILRRKDPWAGGDGPARDEGAASRVPTLATLFNLHTGEMLPLSEEEPTRERFAELLEDRGMRSRVDIAPELLEMLRALARASPGRRIDIVSGHRSAKRNEMMRKKGRGVASHSQHVLGRAIDFRIEGMNVAEIVRALEDLGWSGGIGRYDGRADLFVHADVGPRRRWRGR